MNIKRSIAEGVAGWLMYEFRSFRGNLFEEKYLLTPISNVLSGVYKDRVISEFDHPILNAHKTWPGRPPQIDFVIKGQTNPVEIAVESKWYGNSPVKVEDILWDLIRLELLHKEYSSTCFFVLGGQKKRLEALFTSDRFQEPKQNGRKRPILRIKKERKQAVRLDNPPPSRAKLIKPRMQQYENVSMPTSIVTGYPDFYPLECRNSDFQVYVWEIQSFRNKPRFFPKNNQVYR